MLAAEDLHHKAEAGEYGPVQARAAGGRVVVTVLSQEPDITIITLFSLFYSADIAEQSNTIVTTLASKCTRIPRSPRTSPCSTYFPGHLSGNSMQLKEYFLVTFLCGITILSRLTNLTSHAPGTKKVHI